MRQVFQILLHLEPFGLIMTINQYISPYRCRLEGAKVALRSSSSQRLILYIVVAGAGKVLQIQD